MEILIGLKLTECSLKLIRHEMLGWDFIRFTRVLQSTCYEICGRNLYELIVGYSNSDPLTPRIQ